MNAIAIQYYKSSVGELIIGSFDGKICICDWRYRKMRTTIDARIQKGVNAEYVEGNSEIITETINQLEVYFAGKRFDFNIPLLFVGSAFQKQVWNELIQIPYGTTKSYLDLAKKMNNEGAIRAVASVNGANAISIIVPCHRIIGSDGSLTGYAGGLPAKKKLLQIEGVDLNNGQLNLFT